MSIPVDRLTGEQQEWYAQLMIAAILADNEISVSEIDFLKHVITMVSDPEKKKDLMSLVSSKNVPAITAPKNINPVTLAAIFTEILLVMISDLEFVEHERDFLVKISSLFGFSKMYFKELMQWADDGLKWKKARRSLVTVEDDDFAVPLGKMNSEQKNWYARILISTIMLDRMIDGQEIEIMKKAVSVVDSQKAQKDLLGHIRNKVYPPITEPPELDENILILVFIELFLLISADEIVTFKEISHLRLIARHCKLTEAKFQELLDWCNDGVFWKKSKNSLIKRVNVVKKKKPRPNREGLERHQECNSIFNQAVGCFVCDTKKKITAFQLVPESHKVDQNIFSVTIYPEAAEGYEFVDYNQISVTVCPTCYFAGADSQLFRRNDELPLIEEIKDKKFKVLWLKGVKNRKELFKSNPDEIFTIKRSFKSVANSYQIAVEAQKIISKLNNSIDHQMSYMLLLLKYAEVLASVGDQTGGDKQLNMVKSIAGNIFNGAADRTLFQVIQSAQILFFLSLYFSDFSTAEKLKDYLTQVQTDKKGSIKPARLKKLHKINEKVKFAFKNAEAYTRNNLNRYRLKKK
jgi:hypothetical protein